MDKKIINVGEEWLKDLKDELERAIILLEDNPKIKDANEFYTGEDVRGDLFLFKKEIDKIFGDFSDNSPQKVKNELKADTQSDMTEDVEPEDTSLGFHTPKGTFLTSGSSSNSGEGCGKWFKSFEQGRVGIDTQCGYQYRKNTRRHLCPDCKSKKSSEDVCENCGRTEEEHLQDFEEVRWKICKKFKPKEESA